MPVDKNHPLAHQLPRHRFGLFGFAGVIDKDGLELLTQHSAIRVDVGDGPLSAGLLLFASAVRTARQRSGDPDLDLRLRRRDRKRQGDANQGPNNNGFHNDLPRVRGGLRPIAFQPPFRAFRPCGAGVSY